MLNRSIQQTLGSLNIHPFIIAPVTGDRHFRGCVHNTVHACQRLLNGLPVGEGTPHLLEPGANSIRQQGGYSRI